MWYACQGGVRVVCVVCMPGWCASSVCGVHVSVVCEWCVWCLCQCGACVRVVCE